MSKEVRTQESIPAGPSHSQKAASPGPYSVLDGWTNGGTAEPPGAVAYDVWPLTNCPLLALLQGRKFHQV